jgi:hypothetical protein
MQDCGDNRQSRQALHRRAQKAEAEVARLTRGLTHLGHILRQNPNLADLLTRTSDYWAIMAMDLDVLRHVERKEESDGKATDSYLRQD